MILFLDGQNKEEIFKYPSLLHFCAANGLSEVSEWLLYNTPDDRRSLRNSEGLTPAQLAEKGNYVDLEKVALKYSIRYQMI